MRLHPFRALRPRPEHAADVASVPYDVVDRAEAAALAADNPLSFLRVVRAEIELAPDVDPYDDRVYARARANLDGLRARGVLVQDDAPSLYVYRLEMDGRAQTGLVGCVHVDDYERGLIKRHEKTRPDKENDRTRHILALHADAEPVLLTYRDDPNVDRAVAAATRTAPLYQFQATDSVRHTVWRAGDAAAGAAAFAAVPAVYVADGHHRCASAARAGSELRGRTAQPRGDAEYHWFPAALFPASQLRIMAYNRVVKDLAGQTAAQVLERLAALGKVTATRNPLPSRPGSFAVYLERRWHLVELDPASIDRTDPIGALDCQLLQTRVLEPILRVGDPRTDKRIDFVGGIRGPVELQRRVDAGQMAIAFSLYPTGIDQLLAVADAGAVMPPKSTWFEPKLRSGLFVHLLED